MLTIRNLKKRRKFEEKTEIFWKYADDKEMFNKFFLLLLHSMPMSAPNRRAYKTKILSTTTYTPSIHRFIYCIDLKRQFLVTSIFFIEKKNN